MPQEISAFNPSQMMIRTDFEAYHYREPHFHSLDFHSHDFYELYVFLDGSVTYYIEEKVYDLCAGDLLLIPPGKMHRPVLIENAPIYERIVLWINSGFLHSLGGGFVRCFADAEERKNFLCRPSPQSFRYLRETLSRLIRCMQLKEVLKRAYLTAALEEISHSFPRNSLRRDESGEARNHTGCHRLHRRALHRAADPGPNLRRVFCQQVPFEPPFQGLYQLHRLRLHPFKAGEFGPAADPAGGFRLRCRGEMRFF